MARDTYFVAKTDVAAVELLEVGGSPAVEHHEALQAALLRHGGPALADLFAEPIYRRGDGEVPGVISWYGYLSDSARPISALDDAERTAVETILRRKLLDVMPALRDAQIGPLVGAALHIRDRADILVLGDRPLIINWGMLPEAVGHTPAARQTHFAATLGPYLPLDEAPPLSSEDIRALPVDPPTPSPIATQTKPVSARGGTASTSDNEPTLQAPPRPLGSGWRWIPLLALLTLALIAMVLVLWPGVLRHPQQPVISHDEIAKIGGENNDALRERRDRLRAALDGTSCTPDGQIEFPTVSLPAADGTSDQAVATPDDLIAPPAERVQVPAEDGEAVNLLSYIEARTAMVLVVFENGAGSGSGFFVTPDLFVTNDHVVRGAKADQAKLGAVKSIWVKSRTLKKGLPAEIVSTSGQAAEFGRDFALLRVAGADAAHFPLWRSTASIKLQDVTAAGFPGAYLTIDQSRSSMYDPNTADMPDMIMTQGTVNAQQKVGPNGTLAFVHSADISSGNSGGPLIDQCGRVVGVNTFGIQDDVTKRWLNFSLHTAELLEFLGDQADAVTQTSKPCLPQVAALPRVSQRDRSDETPRDKDAPAASDTDDTPLEQEDASSSDRKVNG